MLTELSNKVELNSFARSVASSGDRHAEVVPEDAKKVFINPMNMPNFTEIGRSFLNMQGVYSDEVSVVGDPATSLVLIKSGNYSFFINVIDLLVLSKGSA